MNEKDKFVIKTFNDNKVCGIDSLKDPNTISLNANSRFVHKLDGNVSKNDCSNLIQTFKKENKVYGLFINK